MRILNALLLYLIGISLLEKLSKALKFENRSLSSKISFKVLK